MKAVEFSRYGNPDVLYLTHLDKPSPRANELLIKVHATSVTATECVFRRGEPYISRLFTGLFSPNIRCLGEEMAGTVEAVGSKVTEFQVGDQVFGSSGPQFGANAEYICIPESGVLAIKPRQLSPQQAAASVDGFLTALPFLRDVGKLKSGDHILIYGASGSVGTAAVQIAHHFNARVTAVCSGTNATLVKSIGADHAIDYTRSDFTKNGLKYDLIFDTVGKLKFSECKRSLTKHGIFLEAGINLGILPMVLLTSLFSKKKLKIAATGLRSPKLRKKDLLLLKSLLESEKIKTVIDRTYPLEQIVDAHRYVELGHKKGNVAITIS